MAQPNRPPVPIERVEAVRAPGDTRMRMAAERIQFTQSKTDRARVIEWSAELGVSVAGAELRRRRIT